MWCRRQPDAACINANPTSTNATTTCKTPVLPVIEEFKSPEAGRRWKIKFSKPAQKRYRKKRRAAASLRNPSKKIDLRTSSPKVQVQRSNKFSPRHIFKLCVITLHSHYARYFLRLSAGEWDTRTLNLSNQTSNRHGWQRRVLNILTHEAKWHGREIIGPPIHSLRCVQTILISDCVVSDSKSEAATHYGE